MNSSSSSLDQQAVMKIPCVTNNGECATEFGFKEIDLQGQPLRRLSEQQQAENFRLRTSSSDYSSDWHVAGDPTLLIILKGAVEIELRNGDKQQFGAGSMFIAEDHLNADISFTDKHGHRAAVVGEQTLEALHLKLSKQS